MHKGMVDMVNFSDQVSEWRRNVIDVTLTME